MDLAEADGSYNEDQRLIGSILTGPGYHTQVPIGTLVHPTRESLDYALALLATGEGWRIARAGDIIGRVLSLQETDPTKATYGIWPWLGEESLEEMNPPDWNWADFIGMRLIEVLCEYAQPLDSALVGSINSALGHAGWSIFRRNVQPGYTNIAIMGAGVALAAGELLDEPRLLVYGRTRLRRFVEHVTRNGEFDEYNSPGYTVVALDECEKILRFVRDPEALADAEIVQRKAWLTIAEHYHPGTAQWAGPHGRNYHDLINPMVIPGLLARSPGCPPELSDRFDALPEPQHAIHRRYLNLGDERSVWGWTWFSKDACLGSASRENLWHQRRPLIGYWKSGGDSVAVLRVRFLLDGLDFSSAVIRVSQDGPRALTAVNLVTGYGGFHPSLNKPADGRFTASDIRVRWQLTSPDATVADLGDGAFALTAGPYRAVIHTAPGVFGAEPVTWEVGADADTVFVDGVCHTGTPLTFHPADIGPVIVVAAVEILGEAEASETGAPIVTPTETDKIQVDWAGLRVASPTIAEAA